LNKEIVSLFGLIGFPLTHSWSANYFADKFSSGNIQGESYELFPVENLSDFKGLLESHDRLRGLNVTIPYKEKIMPYLDDLDDLAKEIGAVNTIRIIHEGKKILTKGYNTDADGFLLSADFKGYSFAYILGTGGASRAVAYSLKKLGIPFCFVSRNPARTNTIPYPELATVSFSTPTLIINATPVGMFPETGSCPRIPYEKLTPKDFLYDLVYNPAKTLFLKNGEEKGARIQGGLKMLQIQAEKSYGIWKSGITS
jgi:shikimate dehydrogenase